MQAFTAKGLNEEWVITRNAYILDKLVSKTTKQAVIRKHISIIYLNGGRALPAFHAEKRKALAKGLKITNFDSTVKKPKANLDRAVVKEAKILGRRLPLEI